MNLIPYHGILVRADNVADKTVVKQCFKNYKRFAFDSTARALDFGTFIGAFGVMAINAGCRNYLGVEADPENFSVAIENLSNCAKGLQDCSWSILQGAGSVSEQPTLTFFQTDSKQKYNCGTVAVDSRNVGHRPIRKEVANFSIDTLINDFKPTHLKMDIEGAENDWLEKNGGAIHESVKEFALEVHRAPKIMYFAEKILPRMLHDFDLIYCDPMLAFSGVSENVVEIPALNIKGKGSLIAVDLFFRRK